MDETAYDFESAVWHDIENNREHLKRDGEHYVADAMLLRESISLRQENERLRDENARLRSCLSDDAESARQIMGESAKLRELVRYMYRCFVRGHDWGPYCAGETVWVEDSMRELGIEV